MHEFPQHSTLNVFLAGAGPMGSVMVSYASARAESLIPKCDVGFLKRPERVVLFIIGALSTSRIEQFLREPHARSALGARDRVLLDFAHRMYHTWRELNNVEATAKQSAAQSAFAKPESGPDRLTEPRLAHKTG